jgi:hypothetical protein
MASQYWHPGGVKHAARIGSHKERKYLESDMDIVRQKVHVEVRGLGLSWVRPGRLIVSEQRKRILDNVNFTCPAGQITAIMVSRYLNTNT